MMLHTMAKDKAASPIQPKKDPIINLAIIAIRLKM
jgi:hypothetical protein